MEQVRCNAANDSVFSKSKGRTIPIPNTVFTIPKYPSKLKIYKTKASQFWQVRCYFLDKYIVKSLKTVNKDEAICAAKNFYTLNVLKISGNIEDNECGFEHKFETLIGMLKIQEQKRAHANEISEITFKVINSLLNKHISVYFKNTSIESVTETHLIEYLDYLKLKKLKPVSISQNLTTLKKIYLIAIKQGWIKEIPTFPKVKKTTIPRGGFSIKEYWKILRATCPTNKSMDYQPNVTHRNTRGGIFAKDVPMPHEFRWLIRFMVNTFVRPVDIKIIQHKHIQIVRGDYCYLRISLPETKLHNGQIVSLPAAVHIYEKLKEYFDAFGLSQPNDYLFMPTIKNRSAAISLMDMHFKKILDGLGIRHGTRGQIRTLYSLRHSSITYRLLYGKGIDLLTLAKNARTSVEMIEKHYASELSAEMNIAMLHSRRKI